MARSDPKLKEVINPLKFLKKPTFRRYGISNLEDFIASNESE